MALIIVKGLLHQYVQSLFDEGIVNDQFARIQGLKTKDEPDHVVQLISAYCTEVETILSAFEGNIELSDIDFCEMTKLAEQIEKKSSDIGAEHVRLACVDLVESCHQMSKRNLFRAFDWTRNEFSNTKNMLQAFVRMERKILRLESKQK